MGIKQFLSVCTFIFWSLFSSWSEWFEISLYTVVILPLIHIGFFSLTISSLKQLILDQTRQKGYQTVPFFMCVGSGHETTLVWGEGTPPASSSGPQVHWWPTNSISYPYRGYSTSTPPTSSMCDCTAAILGGKNTSERHLHMYLAQLWYGWLLAGGILATMSSQKSMLRKGTMKN